MDGYQRLASAIVASGINDYYKAGKKAVECIHLYLSASSSSKKRLYMDSFEKEYRVLVESKSFLLSGYFSILTDLNGPVIHEKLNRRIGEYANERFLK